MKTKNIDVGDKVKIGHDLGEVLWNLGFDVGICANSQQEYAGKVCLVYAVWEDDDTKQVYVTIDLCVEIPIQCCELFVESEI